MFTGCSTNTNTKLYSLLREDPIIYILLVIIPVFYINYMAQQSQNRCRVFIRNVEIKIHFVLILYPEVTLRAGRQTSENQ